MRMLQRSYQRVGSACLPWLRSQSASVQAFAPYAEHAAPSTREKENLARLSAHDQSSWWKVVRLCHPIDILEDVIMLLAPPSGTCLHD